MTCVEQMNPKELYGSKVDEIIRRENELQYAFDSYCSMKKPVLWPGMAFNSSVPGDFDNLYLIYFVTILM